METLPLTGIEHYGDRVDSTQCACISHHSLVQKTHLIPIIIFLSNLSSPTYYLSSTKKASTLHNPARMLRTLWYQNPTAPTVVRLPSAEDPQETKRCYPTASPSIRDEGLTISHAEKPSACITNRILRPPAKSAFKRLILRTPLCQHHVLSMSMITGIIELTDVTSHSMTPRPARTAPTVVRLTSAEDPQETHLVRFSSHRPGSGVFFWWWEVGLE